MDKCIHTKQQKDKARKRGASARSKILELGKHCDIFAAAAYWDPTHKRMEAVMHVPKDQVAPDFNEIFNNLSNVEYRRNETKKRTRSSQNASIAKKHCLENQVITTDDVTGERQPRRISERIRAKGSTGLEDETELLSEVVMQENDNSSAQDKIFCWTGGQNVLDNNIQAQNPTEQSFQPELHWSRFDGTSHRVQARTSKRGRVPTTLTRRVIKLLEELVAKYDAYEQHCHISRRSS